jgi:hypothetical protein
MECLAALGIYAQEKVASRLGEGLASRLTDSALLLCFLFLYCSVNTLKALYV